MYACTRAKPTHGSSGLPRRRHVSRRTDSRKSDDRRAWSTLSRGRVSRGGAPPESAAFFHQGKFLRLAGSAGDGWPKLCGCPRPCSTVSTASAQTAATHRGPRPRRAGAAATHWVSSTTRHRGCPGCPRLRRHRGCPRSRCSTLFVYPPELQTLATSVLENSGCPRSCPRSCPKLLGVSEASKALLVGYPSFPVLFGCPSFPGSV